MSAELEGRRRVREFVRVDEVYTKTELQRRLRMGRQAIKVARQQGLRAVVVAKRLYFTGRDVLAFFQGQSDEQNA